MIKNHKIMIIAGTYNQARYWAQIQNLKPGEWQYIYDTMQLCGLRNFGYVKVGTWYEHKSYYEVKKLIELQNGIECGSYLYEENGILKKICDTKF